MIRILTDSTSDLSQDIIGKYGILVTPLHVYLGDEEYIDGVNISPEEIYSWSDASHSTPTTSAPAISDVAKIFGEYSDDQFICFSISSEMSTTGNVMHLAADEAGRTDDITVIDSRNLSTGIGHLLVEAAVMSEKNKSVNEITDYIYDLIPRVQASLVVNTLTFLYRGGR